MERIFVKSYKNLSSARNLVRKLGRYHLLNNKGKDDFDIDLINGRWIVYAKPSKRIHADPFSGLGIIIK